MTRDDIIKQIYSSAIVPRYVNKFCGGAYRADITAELYLYICELPSCQLVSIYNKGGMTAVYSYICGILVNQLLSNNSKIYKKYTVHSTTEHPTAMIWVGESTQE